MQNFRIEYLFVVLLSTCFLELEIYIQEFTKIFNDWRPFEDKYCLI